ncbi:MAG: ATP-binding protein, partial [Deltaproteobacteria bacterium]|nr:ATP-binding protein [Deltaproteobacteria bacterium]
ANLKSQQRQQFIELAKSLDIPYYILNFKASEEILRKRVKERAQHGSDISDATLEVLENQIAGYEPLLHDEQQFTIEVDTGKGIDIERIVDHIYKNKGNRGTLRCCE